MGAIFTTTAVTAAPHSGCSRLAPENQSPTLHPSVEKSRRRTAPPGLPRSTQKRCTGKAVTSRPFRRFGSLCSATPGWQTTWSDSGDDLRPILASPSRVPLKRVIPMHVRISQKKKAGILASGLVDHEMVAGVRFELTTFGLCDLTQLSLRVGLYLHPAEPDARHPVSTPSSFF